jgi:RecA-family ATPase
MSTKPFLTLPSSIANIIELSPSPGDLSPGNHGSYTSTHHKPKGKKSNGGDTEPAVRLQWIDPTKWDTEPCPPREWAVLDRIPLRQVTLFSGEGAVGKSILELMLAVAHVTGKDWLGSLPEPGGAFYIGCEDDEQELRIRLTAIATHYGTTFNELKANGFRFKSLAGEDAVMAAPDRNGIIKPTTLFDQLYEQAGDLKPKHIGIDTSADVYVGNEVDRTQVRQFIGLLRRLAMVSMGSVVLLSHPSLTGINTGTGISGSTAWHNSVRARMYMTAPKIEAGEQPDSDLREIIFKKLNYGPKADSLVLRYQRGLFLPEAGLSGIDKAAREAKVEEAFLAITRKLETRGQELSPSPTSHHYAPTIVSRQPEAKGLKKSEFVAALDRLLDQRKVRVATLRAGSSREKKIIKVGLGNEEG